MVNALVGLALLLALTNIIFFLILLNRVRRTPAGNAEQALREELRQGREESAQAARDLREEVGQVLKLASDTTVRTVGELSAAQKVQLDYVVAQMKSLNDVSQKQLEGIQTTVNSQLKDIERGNERKLDEIRQTVESSANTTAKAARYLREEVNASLKATADSVVMTIGELATLQQSQLNSVVTQLKSQSDTSQASLDGFRLATDQRLRLLTENNEKKIEELRLTIEAALRATMEESGNDARQLREEVKGVLISTGDSTVKTIGEMALLQRSQLVDALGELKSLTETSQTQLGALRTSVDQQLTQIRESNEKKLEEMRKTVDEQLQGTLERRLGDSFSLVSERLEAVQRGLGEMQTLATGVGDLKRALTNVKTRGTWGEFQLGAILEQILTPEQYSANVRTNENSLESVEYAIRLPGRLDDPGSPVWLPIDSKFPLEDYRRLTEASEAGNAEGVAAAVAALAATVQVCAQTICEKYLNPPKTTDFAILFLPTEGLYGEVLRHPGLVEVLQNTYRVTVAGPTTLAAILNSLRMGFKTLAIEHRASEVWNLLGGIKSEFGKFGVVLDKVKSQLETAGSTIDKTLMRTRAMQRKLRDVEELPDAVVADELSLPEEASESTEADLVGVSDEL